jgi:YidC/Oxa1 family membrane protein insertase
MIRAASTLRHGIRSQVVRSRLSEHGAPMATFSEDENTEKSCNGTCSLSQFSLNYTMGNNASFQRRHMTTDSTPPNASFDETMNKLFHEAQTEATGEDDAWFLDQAANAWEPSWWNLADQAVNGVHLVQELTGLHYAGAIFTTTCVLRLFIFPLALRGQRAASRMSHLQPELAVIKKRYEALGTPSSAEQQAFAGQMKALFKRYDVKPMQSLAAPLVQMPMFIGMFFGMKKMPDLFPEDMAVGGIMWFTNLTIPDPTYILPIICGLSFIATIEAGKEQMIDSSPQYGPVMVNAFRAMAFVMVPVMTTFPAAMLCYWVPNNFLTLVQSVTLRNEWVKKQAGIWERPKPVPGTNADAGFQETMSNLVKQVKGEPTTDAAKIKIHNEEIATKKRVQQMSKTTRARRRGTK